MIRTPPNGRVQTESSDKIRRDAATLASTLRGLRSWRLMADATMGVDRYGIARPEDYKLHKTNHGVYGFIGMVPVSPNEAPTYTVFCILVGEYASSEALRRDAVNILYATATQLAKGADITFHLSEGRGGYVGISWAALDRSEFPTFVRVAPRS